MSRYYKLLGLETTASPEEIEAAYTRQRERYSPDRVASVDDEMWRVAQERTAELEHAYQVLSDPERRHQYDISEGLAPAQQGDDTARAQRSLSRREVLYACGGILVAIVLIAAIWTLSGRESNDLPAIGEVDRPAPDFTLPALDGTDVALSDYTGQVVLLNFWGTWCEPCRREMPALQASYEQLRDQGFVIIGVNLADNEKIQGNSEDDIQAFADYYGVTYPIALDVDGDVANAYRLFPLPTSYFVDGEGRIRYVRVGELTAEEITALFEQLQQPSTALYE